MRILVLVILLLFAPWIVRAQEYSYVNYNVKDGLAGSVVYHMVQDHDGFIWFATELGISRFDGTGFKNFTTQDGLPDNEVLKLHVDSENRVWIIPYTNKVCYYRNGRIYHEGNDSLVRKLAIKDLVSSVVEYKNGELAFIEPQRVIIKHRDSSVVHISIPEELRNPIAYISHGGLDFDSTLIFRICKHRGYNLSRIVNDTMQFGQNKIEEIGVASNTLLLSPFIRTEAWIDSLRLITRTCTTTIARPRDLISLSVLNDSLMALTGDRTYTYNFLRQKVDRHFFRDKHITYVMEDLEGNIWFSTAGEGVYRLASSGFMSWKFTHGDRTSQVYSLKKTGAGLWIGADRNLVWNLNINNNCLRQIMLGDPLNMGRVTAIEKLSGDTLVFGTDAGMFFRKDKRIAYKSANAVKSIQILGDSIMLASNLGVVMWVRTGSFTIRYLLASRSNTALKLGDWTYFGTPGGLYGSYQYGKPKYLGNIHKSFQGRISILAASPDNTLWVGTYGSGVVGYRDGKVTHVLNKDSGLTSNIIRTIFVAPNALWLGTGRGLNKVQWIKGRAEITRYTTSDGLPSDMINAVLVESNKVYVGTPAGLTCFEEDKVFTNSMCVLHLLEIRSGRRRWISDTSAIRFGHFERDIRFGFTGISFKSAGEIEYRYRLKGLDSSWQTTRERFLQYPTLPSGSYQLELQAINKFGVSSAMISIPFEVEYLLHEKTWFRVILVLVAAMGIWLYVTYRVGRIRRQEQMKTDTNRKIAELEQMALRAQMNPHFIFNSLNSIQHYVFDKDIEGANRFITAFSRLIRLTLELSTRARISLEEEQHFLQTYLELEKKRFNNKFRYRIEIEKGIASAMSYIPPMMLQPYIENSIRHGIRYREDNKGMVLVRFSKEGDYLACCIEDNGIGRARSNELKGQTPIEYQSRGMTLTARRIEMINKSFILPIDINISDIYTDNRVAGTRVTIRIPLQEVTKPTY